MLKVPPALTESTWVGWVIVVTKPPINLNQPCHPHTLRNASRECGPFLPSTRCATATPAQLTTTFTVPPSSASALSSPFPTSAGSST